MHLCGLKKATNPFLRAREAQQHVIVQRIVEGYTNSGDELREGKCQVELRECRVRHKQVAANLGSLVARFHFFVVHLPLQTTQIEPSLWKIPLKRRAKL